MEKFTRPPKATTESGFSLKKQLEQETAEFQKDIKKRNILEHIEKSLFNLFAGLSAQIIKIKDQKSRGDGTDNPTTPTTTIPTTTETTVPQPPVITPPIVVTPPPVITPPVIVTTKPQLDIKDLIQEQLDSSKGQYYKEEFPKKQIYLHHTASSANPLSAINWWRNQSNGVSTFTVIAGKPIDKNSKYKDGEIYQCFSSKYWSWHLGLKDKDLKKFNITHRKLSQQSIGIEICNWGPLEKKGDKFYCINFGYPVPESDVIEYKDEFKGHRYYQKYSDAQIESVRKLLDYLCSLYNIPKTYQGDSMFSVNDKALAGTEGIFTHTSVRTDKYDCHPQPELINMLKNI